ncbi:hypothetical protein ACFE04_007971 [Oxalis oulophora]
MPVSTRASQLFNNTNDDQEEQRSVYMRNPHHGLKEKMKALTQLYDQQKRASLARKNASPIQDDKRFTTNPSVHLLDSAKKDEKESNLNVNVMGENTRQTRSSSTVTRNIVMPQPRNNNDDSKENVATGIGQNRIIAFSAQVKKGNGVTTVARKLSLPGNQLIGEVKNMQETEKIEGVLAATSRILVFVRLRPMAKKEKEAGSRCCVRIVNRKEIYLTEFASENDYLRLKRLRGRHFTFDASLPETTTQQEVYSTTTSELVEAVLQGRNGSVFCYGATGAGKTYTMLGTTESPGVMVLAIKDLFTKIRQRSCDGNHVVRLSYLEVYNETVRDLLSPGRPLVLREDKQGITASGLTQYRAYSTDEVMALLHRGNLHRTTEPTRANETSSRSHAILQVMVEYKVKDVSNNIVNRVGKLSLIDLAGSERALATDQRTLRSLEGANINRSLLALSSCINALVERKKHIPFRNSKLTQLLKDSLGGACNTVMIANISPSNLSFGETQNTLHWADRAKEIRTKATEVNEEIQNISESETEQAKLLLELQNENRELRLELAKQQQKLLTLQTQALAEKTSPTPSSVTSHLETPPTIKPTDRKKSRPSFLGGNCFTPDSKKREGIMDLQQVVKTLEAEIEKMKKDHVLQLKKKDEVIRDLSRKNDRPSETKRVVTRASVRPKEELRPKEDLRSPSHRFKSPAPSVKKRSFWDITTANSPSVDKINGRKIRSHTAAEPPGAPSMLLQKKAMKIGGSGSVVGFWSVDEWFPKIEFIIDYQRVIMNNYLQHDYQRIRASYYQRFFLSNTDLDRLITVRLR